MLGRQDRPIIVGPWLTEAGFELLYWIPFLAWAKAYASLHDDQLIVVSRGGAAPWYRHISPNYHDILSLFSAEEFRQRNDARVHEQKGRLKHIDLGEFDREIIERVTRRSRAGQGQGAAPVAHVQPLQRVLAPAGADHAGRGVQRVPAAAEAAARRTGIAPSARIRRGEVLCELGAAGHGGQPRVDRAGACRSDGDHRRGAAEYRAAVRRSFGLRAAAARAAAMRSST